MATFWAMVIGALFVIAVAVLVFMGARSIREQKEGRTSEKELPSSKNKRERDQREHQLERGDQGNSSSGYEGHVRVYRH